jgi:hypothetical protein
MLFCINEKQICYGNYRVGVEQKITEMALNRAFKPVEISNWDKIG